MESAADEKAEAAAELQMEESRRKRKFISGESELSTSSVIFKTRRSHVVTPENSASSASSGNSTSCESVSSGQVLASCCSSSRRLSAQAKEASEIADLDEHNEVTVEFFTTSAGHSAGFTYGLVNIPHIFRRDKRPSSKVEAESGEMDPKTIPRGSDSLRCSTAQKMPSGAELEEFFAAAERNLQQQFLDKYNYDIVKDEPVEGRYEWVQIQRRKPCSSKKLKKKAFTI